jgi:hypothetical protein
MTGELSANEAVKCKIPNRGSRQPECGRFYRSTQETSTRCSVGVRKTHLIFRCVHKPNSLRRPKWNPEEKTS